MITWVRASLVHEDTKLKVIKEFCVSIPRWHSRGIVRWLAVAPRRIRPLVPALAPSLDQSTDHTHSTTHRQVVAVVLLLPSSTRQFLVGLR